MMNFYKDVINFLQTDDLLPQEDLETKVPVSSWFQLKLLHLFTMNCFNFIQ